MVKKIHYASALPGSGKTHAAKKHICKLQKAKEAVIVALPTIKLMNEVEEGMDDTISVVSDIHLSSVQTIDIAVNTTNLDGKALLITHSALTRLNESTLKQCGDIHLIIDETCCIIKKILYYDLNQSLSEDGILSTLVERVAYNDNVQMLKLKDNKKEYTKFMRKCDEKNTISLTETKELLRAIKDKTNLVLISKIEKSNKYAIAIMVNHEIFKYFKSVLVLSAHFEHTIMYHYLKDHFKMVDITEKMKLRSMEHRLEAIELYPLVEFSDGAVYSKYKRETCVISHTDDVDEVIAYYRINGRFSSNVFCVLEFTEYVIDNDTNFQDSKILRVCNNDDFESVNIGNLISSKSHGINSYTHFETIALVLALNPQTRERKMLNNIFPYYDIINDRLILTLIQNIARTSFRLPDSNSVVKVIVPDMTTALMIQKMLDGKPKIKKHSYYDVYIVLGKSDYEKPAESGHFKSGKKKMTVEEQKLKRQEYDKKRYRETRKK